MPDPDALWKDIQKLDDMYEELLWHPDDELQFTHDGQRSHYYKQNTRGTRQCLMKAEKLNGRAAMVGFIAAVGSYLATGQVIQVYGERHVTHSSIHGRRVYLCCPID